jgi:hypothetical protein
LPPEWLGCARLGLRLFPISTGRTISQAEDASTSAFGPHPKARGEND